MKYAAQVQQIAPGGKFEGVHYVFRNPTRADKSAGSLTFNCDSGLWRDFACGDGGSGLASLSEYLTGDAGDYDDHLPQQQAPVDDWQPVLLPEIPATIQVHAKGREYTATYSYVYRTPDGLIQFVVRRQEATETEKKKFTQYRPVQHIATGEIRWLAEGVRGLRTLWRIERLRDEMPVLVPEGEKAALAAVEFLGEDFDVVTWAGGSSSHGQADWSQLRGRTVVIWPDNDPPGFKSATEIEIALRPITKMVAIVKLPELPPKWDLADPLPEEMQASPGVFARRYIGQALTAAAEARKKAEAKAYVAPKRLQFTQRVAGTGHVWPVPKNPRKPNVPASIIRNVEFMLDLYGVKARLNLMSSELEIAGVESTGSSALTEIESLAALNDLPSSAALKYTHAIGWKNAYCPVRDWISATPWDNVDRLCAMYDTIAVAEGKRGYRDAVLRRWFVQAVAAIFEPEKPEPGHYRKFETCLILQGAEGFGKTSWVQSLAPNFARTGVQFGDLSKADEVRRMIEFWIVELGEFNDSVRKSGFDQIMNFLSRTEDVIRTPYAATHDRYPRRSVYVATTNPVSILAHANDHRRFPVLGVTAVNHKHGLDMQQVWAQVLHMYRTGVIWWPTETERAEIIRENKSFKNIDPVEDALETKYGDLRSDGPVRWMTATEIAAELPMLGAQGVTKLGIKLAAMDIKKERRGARFVYGIPIRPQMVTEREELPDDGVPF